MSYLADLERKYLAALEEIKRLTAEVQQLRSAVTALNGAPLIPIELRLTKFETRMLVALMEAGAAIKSKEALLAAAYADRWGTDDEPEIRIVDVFVCQLRKKFIPHGIRIETVWGQGYHLPQESRAIIDRMNEASMDKVIRLRARSA
jgi:two-component system cell cycle response regulator CtrA